MVESAGFAEYHVPVEGGSLAVLRWPARHDAAAGRPPVVAVHGITANALTWSAVVEAVAGQATILGVDLRGRAGSREITGPWGIERDADDVIAVLDEAGIERAVLVGHSLGAYVACVAASRHPERVSGLLALDGGLGFPLPADLDPRTVLPQILGPALERLSMTFASRSAYHDFWRAHPAFTDNWSPHVAAYVDRDLVGEPPKLVSSCVSEAIIGDGTELLTESLPCNAIRTLKIPVRLLYAERGMFDQPQPAYTRELLDSAGLDPRFVSTFFVPDTNHYTILFRTADVVARHILEL